jgi:hypothetical protein
MRWYDRWYHSERWGNMMKFFKNYFRTLEPNDQGEAFCCCPFTHTDENGEDYLEQNASAHVNTIKNLFHCKVCGEGMSEVKFLAKVQGVSYREALQLLEQLSEEHDDWNTWRHNFLNSGGSQELWKGLGLPLSLADDLKIGYEGTGISFPVFIYDELLDVRTYNPEGSPKVMSRRGAKPLILPFDLWRTDDRPTLLCAGEKDMSIARHYGFNAITFTGGEQAFPKLFKASFKGKRIYIVYDNDMAGQQGSKKIATLLKECGAIPHIVTGHYSVCTGKGEDIHDFFQKYNQSPDYLQRLLDETPAITEEEYQQERNKLIPMVSLEESTQGQYSNRLVSSKVQVIATFEEVYQVPEFVEFEKTMPEKPSDSMYQGERKIWSLDTENVRDVLYLMDSGLREKAIMTNLYNIVGIPEKEKGISMSPKSKMNIFKAVVSDDAEKTNTKADDNSSPLEITLYCVGIRLKSGEKYQITYKPVPHPLQAQQMVGVVTQAETASSSVTRFKVTPEIIDSLKCFQVRDDESVGEKMDEIAERVKGFAGSETNKNIAHFVDLFYHTPLDFEFGRRTIRGYLDMMLVGESRTGKSQTAEALLNMYELGVFTSLKSATVAGLIGGSDQTKGGWKTKLGIIPRNHRGALIMEEFSGGGKDIISQLTDVRSSNVVRIDRVNGSLRVPAKVRMLSISNSAKNAQGLSIPFKQYPNGIKILLDLVGASEDLARYDLFMLVDEPKHYTSPLDTIDLDPFPKESYMNRIRWVWSRKPNQIVFEDEVLETIIQAADYLNEQYNSHLKFFGSEAWKKLARVSVATAGMLCSMDETGENIMVNKEHIRWATRFMMDCYDNHIFKLREYVDAQRAYTECDDASIHALQGLYNKHKTMLLQLEMATDMSQRQLASVSGLGQNEFSEVMNRMAECFFFQWLGDRIIPSERFREGMKHITRETYMKPIGSGY